MGGSEHRDFPDALLLLCLLGTDLPFRRFERASAIAFVSCNNKSCTLPCCLGEVMATGLHHKYPLSRPPSHSLLLFYAYRPVLQTSSAADEAKSQLSKCVELGLSGRLLVADEGLNGTVGGDTLACEAYVQWMCQVRFQGLFSFAVNHT